MMATPTIVDAFSCWISPASRLARMPIPDPGIESVSPLPHVESRPLPVILPPHSYSDKHALTSTIYTGRRLNNHTK